jgi:hypothetical protein
MPRPCVLWCSGLAAEGLVASRALVATVLSGVVCLLVLGHWMGHRHLGGDLIVVLDGGAERLARANQFRQQFPLQQPDQLLIRCPRSPSVPHPMQELLQGYDTATQITALADWLRRRQARPPSASGSLPIRSTLPVPPCWPASPWLAVASRSNRIPRLLPAPANAGSWFVTPCE